MYRDYEAARSAALTKARASVTAGCAPEDSEVGLEYNALYRSYAIFSLPRMANRGGHELRCEVIRPGDPQ
jgi:hypothetical protein